MGESGRLGKGLPHIWRGPFLNTILGLREHGKDNPQLKEGQKNTFEFLLSLSFSKLRSKSQRQELGSFVSSLILQERHAGIQSRSCLQNRG